MSVYQRIKEVRKSLGFTQKDFANELGIKQGSYSDLERAKIGVSAQVLKTLIRKYRISPIWLYDGDGEMFMDHIGNKNDENLIIRYVEPKHFDELGKNIKDGEFLDKLERFYLPENVLTNIKSGIFIEATESIMFPTIECGDYLIAEDTKRLPVDEDLGQIFVIITNNGVITRRLTGKAGSKLEFSADNKFTPSIIIEESSVIKNYIVKARLNRSFNPQEHLVQKIAELEKEIERLSK